MRVHQELRPGIRGGLILLLSLCDCASPPSPETRVRSSTVLLTAPPLRWICESGWGRFIFHTTDDFAGIEFHNLTTQPDVAPIRFSGEKITFVERWFPADASYLMVGTVREVDGRFSLYRISAPMGRPDDSTRTRVLATDHPAYVTRVVRCAETNDLYMLDRRCQDIWIAHDTDGDGWADDIAVEPFARSSEFPNLLKWRGLLVLGVGRVAGSRLPAAAHDLINLGWFEDLVLIDADGDGAADPLN